MAPILPSKVSRPDLEMLSLERRAIDAFVSLASMTDTCINYQTIQAPAQRHVAYGDTGVVIYSNSVCGALQL